MFNIGVPGPKGNSGHHNLLVRRVLMDKESKIKAHGLFYDGEVSKLYKYIKPLIDQNDPDAMYYFSCIGLPSWNESDEEFEVRRWKFLNQAADLGSPEALYKIAVCYSAGDLVERDCLKAATLFKKAAEAGHVLSQFECGLDLLYGSNGCEKDEVSGLNYIRQAAGNDLEEAREFLEKRK